MSVERRRQMIEPGHPRLSVVRQCELVSISRSGFYHRPVGETPVSLELMRLIDAQFLETTWYGSRQMTQHLRETLGALKICVPAANECYADQCRRTKSMAKSETSAPRGTNKVVKAFFETLDSTPDAGRSQVAKAALAAIREKLTARKDKEKATREKEKAKSGRRRAAPAPRKAASSSRTADARKPPAAPAKPARSTKAPDASAPKATKRPASRRAAPKAAAEAPPPRKAAARRPGAQKKPAPEASPMASQTAADSDSMNGGPPEGSASAE